MQALPIYETGLGENIRLAGISVPATKLINLGLWLVEKRPIKGSKRRRSTFDGLMISFWWNIWKERNKRIFNNETKTFEQVAYLIKEEFQQFNFANQSNST